MSKISNRKMEFKRKVAEQKKKIVSPFLQQTINIFHLRS